MAATPGTNKVLHGKENSMNAYNADGIAIITSKDIWDSSYIFVPCKWSASEMIAELDKMGID